MTDIHTLGDQILDSPSPATGTTIDWTNVQPLPREFYDILAGRSAELSSLIADWILTERCLLHDRLTIRGTQYSTFHSNERNSLVFFQPSPTAPLKPGVIRQMFTVVGRRESRDYQHAFLAIHQYLPLMNSSRDPFGAYPDFGASLWSKSCADDVSIVSIHGPIFHAMRMEWSSDTYVLKSLQKVSQHPSRETNRSRTVVFPGLLSYPFKAPSISASLHQKFTQHVVSCSIIDNTRSKRLIHSCIEKRRTTFKSY